MAHAHAHHAPHAHLPARDAAHGRREADRRALGAALALVLALLACEVVAGVLASSLALLSDAAHLLTDAAGLALALVAARLAARPAAGAMTYGLGRVEIMSAQANGVTLLVLGALIIYEAVRRLVSPPDVLGGWVLGVGVAGMVVNLAAVRLLAPASGASLNVEGSYRHLLTDLFAFAAAALAGAVVLATGFRRADPIASLLVAGLMLHSAWALIKASGRVFLEAAPEGVEPDEIGRALASQPDVVEVHDLHVWEVTSGFPALSAHVVLRPDCDCHAARRALTRLLSERFGVEHTTLQMEHETAPDQIIHIESAPAGE